MPSEKPTTLLAALVAAQAEMPALQRDKINPAFKSKYLSLETLLAEVLPVLNRHGIALVQWPTVIQTDAGLEPALRTVLAHPESGETLEDTMLLLLAKKDPQGQGSGITYAKRYAICAVLGISADADDDGNAATTGVQRQRQTTRRTSRPTEAVITETQRETLYAKVRELHIATSRAKEIIKKAAGADDSTKIPATKYDAVLRALDEAKSEAA